MLSSPKTIQSYFYRNPDKQLYQKQMSTPTNPLTLPVPKRNPVGRPKNVVIVNDVTSSFKIGESLISKRIRIKSHLECPPIDVDPSIMLASADTYI